MAPDRLFDSHHSILTTSRLAAFITYIIILVQFFILPSTLVHCQTSSNEHNSIGFIENVNKTIENVSINSFNSDNSNNLPQSITSFSTLPSIESPSSSSSSETTTIDSFDTVDTNVKDSEKEGEEEEEDDDNGDGDGAGEGEGEKQIEEKNKIKKKSVDDEVDTVVDGKHATNYNGPSSNKNETNGGIGNSRVVKLSKIDDNEQEEKEEEENRHNGKGTNVSLSSHYMDVDDNNDDAMKEEVNSESKVVKLDRRPSLKSEIDHDDDNGNGRGDNVDERANVNDHEMNENTHMTETDKMETKHKPKAEEKEKEEEEKSEEEEEEEEDSGEDSEEDDEEYDYNIANNVCTAQYFLDKIIPEDYPTEISKDVKHINETIERLNRMYTFSNQIVLKLNPFFRELASRFTDYLYDAQLDSRCLGALFRIIRGMNQRKPWALSFLDATGPLLTGGYRQGKFVSLGEFDQCLETINESPDENVNNEPIRGQYCLIKPIIPVPAEFRYKQGEPVVQSNIATVNRFLNDEYIETYLGLYKFLKNTILRIGICLPDKCDPIEVENAANKILVRKTGLSVRVGPNCVKATDSVEPNRYQIVTLVIFSILIILTIVCSIYEIIYRMLLDNGRFFPQDPRASLITTPYSFTSSAHQYPIKFMRQMSTISAPYTRQPLHTQLFTTFSIIRNTRVLFEIPAYRKLPLDTFRLILIFFFFISNAYLYTIVFAPMIIKRFYVLGPLQLATEKKYFFLRMYYMLDCFHAFSGISFVLAYNSSQSFSYIKYVIQNYLRYLVPILFSIGLIYIVPLFGSGPLWHLFDETITRTCQDNLWSTVFFYNNIHETVEEICNLPTVFVSLIFQMQLIAPIFLIIATYFRPRRALIVLIVMFSIVSITNVIPRFFYGYKLPYEYQAMKSFTEIKTSIMFYNFNPTMHVSSFIFGIIVGHLMTTQPIRPYRRMWLIGSLSLVGFIISFVYIENLDLKSPNLSTFEIVSMLTFGRVPMLTFFCWIIYASLCGYIVIVRRFLSSIVWRPLAQLSYGFYITSVIVTAYRLFSIRETTTLAAQNMFRTIVSDAVVSFALAYLIHVMVQQPMRNLRQILIHWRQIFNMETTDSPLNQYATNVVFNGVDLHQPSDKFTKIDEQEDEIERRMSPVSEESEQADSIVLNLNDQTLESNLNDQNIMDIDTNNNIDKTNHQ